MKEKNKRGLYVHVPFCKYICDYCDFCKKDIKRFSVDKYVKYLIQEMKQYEGVFQCIDTIYIGGGTPSSLNIVDIEKLLSYLDKEVVTKDIKEYTFEANPDDITEELVKTLSKYKINRISLGVQTLNDDILKSINRHHTKADVQKALSIISKYISNINIDLIFNLPNQRLKDIQDSITFIEENQDKIKHVSYYSLILEEHTKLYIDKYEGIDEDEEDKIYKLIQSELTRLGYKQYEISNFSKSNYRSLHNLKYWEQDEYIGLGLGASGYLGGNRYTNTRSLEKYYRSIDNLDESRYIENSKLNPKDNLEESIFLGLRLLSGIEYSIIKENNIKVDRKYFNIKNNKIAIKAEYLFLSNNIILDILEQI